LGILPHVAALSARLKSELFGCKPVKITFIENNIIALPVMSTVLNDVVLVI
jgi:hypothetical protein